MKVIRHPANAQRDYLVSGLPPTDFDLILKSETPRSVQQQQVQRPKPVDGGSLIWLPVLAIIYGLFWWVIW